VLALIYAVDADYLTDKAWLAEARWRGFRNTDGYAALQVEIVANQVEIAELHETPAQADALGRGWVALAARTHMDHHVRRAVDFISGNRSA
jgi:hypothetical protein